MKKDNLIDLSSHWLFRRGRAGRRWVGGGDSSGVEQVDLPHCWNAVDTFQDNVAYYRGPGAYRKTFRLPTDVFGTDPDGAWILESEGFYGTGDVWLNCGKVAEVDGEYLGFRLDVGKFVMPGENQLAIRLTNRCRSFVLPGLKMPDFLLHGGLAGRVFLRREPSVHLDRSGLQIAISGVDSQCPTVCISSSIHNSSASARSVRVRWTILDPDGRESGRQESDSTGIPARGAHDLAGLRFQMLSPALWSPERPSLYVLRCEILDSAGTVDEFERRFGLRSAVFEPGRGFFLNGKRTELRGCNRHESMPGFGNALPPAVHREDVRLLKETGCNVVRLSHYPQHPAFLDACDETGLMVYAEIATWKSVRTGRWLRRALRQMERMILRDRHRPCIVLWGMGNESRSRKAYLALSSLARSLDPSRPVTYAENHFHRAIREKTADIPDVWGCNYELDALEKGCSASRLRTTLVSECSNMPTAARGNWTEELKQVQVIERDLAVLESKAFNSGCLIWCMNDYATLRKKRYLRYSGVFDAWRLPKMSRAFLQARWLGNPFVGMYGDWGMPGEKKSRGPVREIHVFTNCSRIALFRNGREIVSSAGKPHLVLQVEFEPGVLEARGQLDGREAAGRLRSFGAARGISLEQEPLAGESRGEVVAVGIAIHDSAGAVCEDWSGRVLVKVAGPATLRSFMPDGSVPVAGGKGRTFVAIAGREESVVVEAFCPPLEAGRLDLSCP